MARKARLSRASRRLIPATQAHGFVARAGPNDHTAVVCVYTTGEPLAMVNVAESSWSGLGRMSGQGGTFRTPFDVTRACRAFLSGKAPTGEPD